jgi:hypothetical protein
VQIEREVSQPENTKAISETEEKFKKGITLEVDSRNI